MTKEMRIAMKALAGALFLLFMVTVFTPAQAGGNHDDGDTTQNVTINNYYVTEPQPQVDTAGVSANDLTVYSGASNADLLSLSSSVLAGGAHQFDYSTTKFQMSLTGDFATSDWSDHNEFSVGIGKRFGKNSWVPNALFHGAYTPVLDDGHVTLGVTFVID